MHDYIKIAIIKSLRNRKSLLLAKNRVLSRYKDSVKREIEELKLKKEELENDIMLLKLEEELLENNGGNNGYCNMS